MYGNTCSLPAHNILNSGGFNITGCYFCSDTKWSGNNWWYTTRHVCFHTEVFNVSDNSTVWLNFYLHNIHFPAWLSSSHKQLSLFYCNWQHQWLGIPGTLSLIRQPETSEISWNIFWIVVTPTGRVHILLSLWMRVYRHCAETVYVGEVTMPELLKSKY